MPSPRRPATISAEAFERGARLLAERWNAAEGGVGCAARWVEESDPTRRRVAANGYLAVEDHHAEAEAEAEAKAEAADECAHVDAHVDAVEEDADDASAPFSAPFSAPGRAHVRTYHVAYSPSYRAPVLLIKARWVAAPSRALTHAELERALLRAGGADVGADAGADSGRLLVDGLDGLTAFAPWEHPHSGRDAGGCWTGAHPCETARVMALLLATDPTVRKDENDDDDGVRGDDGEHRFEDDEGALRYMIAWARLATTAVRDFPVPASLR